MTMYNPPHPGEFIKETYLEPFALSQNEVADRLDVAHSTFNRLVRGLNSVSPEMAVRLSKVLGRTPESWLNMQSNYDLYNAQVRPEKFKKLEKINFHCLSF